MHSLLKIKEYFSITSATILTVTAGLTDMFVVGSQDQATRRKTKINEDVPAQKRKLCCLLGFDEMRRIFEVSGWMNTQCTTKLGERRAESPNPESKEERGAGVLRKNYPTGTIKAGFSGFF